MGYVTQKEFSEYINVTPRYARKLLQMGVITKAKNGKLDKDACRIGYINHLRAQAAGRSGNKLDLNLVDERARLAKAQADKTEMEVEVLKENLLAADSVLSEWQACIASCRAKLLSLPTKLAFKISNIDETHEIERFLKHSINESLIELSNYESANETSNS